MWNCLVKLGFLVERSAANGFYTHHIMSHEIRLVWISALWRRDQMNLVFDVPSCSLLLQTVSTSTHCYASVHFMCTSLHNIPAACVLRIHTKGACPHFMSLKHVPCVCQFWYTWSLFAVFTINTDSLWGIPPPL